MADSPISKLFGNILHLINARSKNTGFQIISLFLYVGIGRISSTLSKGIMIHAGKKWKCLCAVNFEIPTQIFECKKKYY